MIALTKQIDEQGLMVFDDIHNMPVYNKPFSTPYMVVVLNLQGWVRAECDMRPVCFKPHDIAILPPRHILCAHESSPDYHAILIVMSVEFQNERKHASTDIFRDNFHYLLKPDLALTDEQFSMVRQLFGMVQKINSTKSANRWQMLGHLLDLLFLSLQDYRRENGIDEHHLSSHELLFNKFYHAITEHYRENREVRFYAEMFHLTPKHFASIIKKHTNINALEWINSYTTIQAKMLLLYQQQKTVQEIALHLGFNDQASFSRFFKSNTGMSPTEYRDVM